MELNLRSWLQAARPAAQINLALPLILGQLLAYKLNGAFSFAIALPLAYYSFAMHLYIVFWNDWADHHADRPNQHPPIFSGGSLSQSTIFGLGIMPYITASIIIQILNSVLPGLQELKQEGASGQPQIQEWTRYATAGLCVDLAIMCLTPLPPTHRVHPERVLRWVQRLLRDNTSEVYAFVQDLTSQQRACH